VHISEGFLPWAHSLGWTAGAQTGEVAGSILARFAPQFASAIRRFNNDVRLVNGQALTIGNSLAQSAVHRSLSGGASAPKTDDREKEQNGSPQAHHDSDKTISQEQTAIERF